MGPSFVFGAMLATGDAPVPPRHVSRSNSAGASSAGRGAGNGAGAGAGPGAGAGGGRGGVIGGNIISPHLGPHDDPSVPALGSAQLGGLPVGSDREAGAVPFRLSHGPQRPHTDSLNLELDESMLLPAGLLGNMSPRVSAGGRDVDTPSVTSSGPLSAPASTTNHFFAPGGFFGARDGAPGGGQGQGGLANALNMPLEPLGGADDGAAGDGSGGR